MGGWESTRQVDGGMADGGMDGLEDERLGRYGDKGMGAWGTMHKACSTLHKAPGLGCTQIPYELKQDPHVSFTLLMVPVFLVSQVESASFPCIKV